MKEEKDILNRDVEIPEVVFRKADAALNQIRTNTGSTKATRKVTRIQGRIHHVQAAAVACAVLIGAGGITATAAVIHHLWSRGMQANIQATEEQQKNLTDQGMVTQFDQAYTSANSDLTGMEVTSEGITVKPMEMIADGHFVHLSFQVEGYDLPDGEEPFFETVKVYTGDEETAEDSFVNMNGSFYNGIICDENGNPMLNANGKKILKSSYSVLQDDFFHFMRNAGYTDVERGERGSTEEHLTVTQFKVQAEQQRLEAVTGQVAQAKRGLENAKAATEKQKKKLEALQKETKTAKTVALTVQEIETMGKKATFGNNVVLTPDECDTLKHYAVNGIIANADNKRLKEKLASAEKTVSIWKQRYEAVSEKYMELKQKAQPFLDALEIASEKVRAFINSILIRGKETQEHEHPARKRGQDMEL